MAGADWWCLHWLQERKPQGPVPLPPLSVNATQDAAIHEEKPVLICSHLQDKLHQTPNPAVQKLAQGWLLKKRRHGRQEDMNASFQFRSDEQFYVTSPSVTDVSKSEEARADEAKATFNLTGTFISAESSADGSSPGNRDHRPEASFPCDLLSSLPRKRFRGNSFPEPRPKCWNKSRFPNV